MCNCLCVVTLCMSASGLPGIQDEVHVNVCDPNEHKESFFLLTSLFTTIKWREGGRGRVLPLLDDF